MNRMQVSSPGSLLTVALYIAKIVAHNVHYAKRLNAHLMNMIDEIDVLSPMEVGDEDLANRSAHLEFALKHSLFRKAHITRGRVRNDGAWDEDAADEGSGAVSDTWMVIVHASVACRPRRKNAETEMETVMQKRERERERKREREREREPSSGKKADTEKGRYHRDGAGERIGERERERERGSVRGRFYSVREIERELVIERKRERERERERERDRERERQREREQYLYNNYIYI